MFSYFDNSLALGVELGTDSIKIVELEANNPLPRLKQFLIKQLSKTSIVGGVIKDYTRLKNRLKLILEDYEFNSREIIASVGEENIFIKRISLPQMTEEEVEDVLRWEASDYISIPLDQVIMDYEIIDKSQDKIELILVAIKEQIVENYVKLLEEIGFKVKAVELPFLALRRVLNLYPNFQEGNVLLVDIGAELSKVTVFKQGKFSFRRSFNLLKKLKKRKILILEKQRSIKRKQM